MVTRSALAVLASCMAGQAAAESLDSVYSDFETRSCRHERGREVESYGSWTCRGLSGFPVRLSAGDQRMYVSFGAAAPASLAAKQTFPAFNDVYSGRVEWRRAARRPFATILRWNVMTASDSENATGPVTPSGRVLVVTRLGPGGSCHVGYVDARANPSPNDLARALADTKAAGFRCGIDTASVSGDTSPGLAMPSR